MWHRECDTHLACVDKQISRRTEWTEPGCRCLCVSGEKSNFISATPRQDHMMKRRVHRAWNASYPRLSFIANCPQWERWGVEKVLSAINVGDRTGTMHDCAMTCYRNVWLRVPGFFVPSW